MKYFFTKLISHKGKSMGHSLSRYTVIKNNKYVGLQTWFNGKWTKDTTLCHNPFGKIYNLYDSQFIDSPLDASKARKELNKIIMFDKKISAAHKEIDKLKRFVIEAKLQLRKLKAVKNAVGR